MPFFHTPKPFSYKKLYRYFFPFSGQWPGSEIPRQFPPMTGTEDFGYVTKEVPGMFVFLGAGKPGNAPLHSPQMALDEEVLPTGAAIYANVAAQWLAEQNQGGELKNE